MRRSDPLLLSVDLGTSAVKAMTVHPDGRVAQQTAIPYRTLTAGPGLLEQRPSDWWQATVRAVRGLEARERVIGVGLCGHMSALVLLDARGRVLRPALLLADSRSGLEPQAVEGLANLSRRTSLVPGAAFTAAKLLWVRKAEPETFARTRHVCFPKDYVRYRMVGEIATEPTDAYNSLLYDPHTRQWSFAVIAALGLSEQLFPALGVPAQPAGPLTEPAAARLGLAPGIAVMYGASDMAATALGMSAYKRAVLSVTIGTAVQVLTEATAMPASARGQVTFHPQADLRRSFVLGSVLSGAGVLGWAAGLLGLGSGARGRSRLSRGALESVPGANGVTFLPFAFGRGTPSFDPQAGAHWLHLRTGVRRADLMGAVFEGVAYSVKDALLAVEGAVGPRQPILLGGAGAKSAVWPQLLADVLQRPLYRMRVVDASAYGAAMLAAVGTGCARDLEDVVRAWVKRCEAVEPDPARVSAYRRGYDRYVRDVKSTLG